MKILYVEDNPANLFLVKRIATIGGHTVLSYIDGEEALRNFANDAPDLVLMDVQLAGEMTGLDVVRKIREEGYNTPIIAVTAYAMIGDRNRCLEAGCDDYIAKPLPVGRLVEMFQHYTDISKLETLEIAKPNLNQSLTLTTGNKVIDVDRIDNEDDETDVMPQSSTKTYPDAEQPATNGDNETK